MLPTRILQDVQNYNLVTLLSVAATLALCLALLSGRRRPDKT